MAQQNLNVGAAANDGTGDQARTGAQKIQANFVELYSHMVADYSIAAPAVLRGTVSLDRYPGVVTGDSVGGTQQVANGTAMQAAINYAQNNGKFLEATPLTYEFNLAGGLRVGGGGIPSQWRGSPLTILRQFAVNTPVVVLSDPALPIEDSVFDGMNLRYGVSQAGQTGAKALVVGAMWRSKIANIKVAAGVTPYIGMHWPSTNAFFFSNTIRDMLVSGSQQNLLLMEATGTGNVWSNIYTNNVSGAVDPLFGDTAQTIAGVPVVFNNNSNDITENVIEQLNIEWCICEKQLSIVAVNGMHISGLHIEGGRMNVAGGSIVEVVAGVVAITGMCIQNYAIRAADGCTTNTANLFGLYQSSLSVRGLRVKQDIAGIAGKMYLVDDTGPVDLRGPTRLSQVVAPYRADGNGLTVYPSGSTLNETHMGIVTYVEDLSLRPDLTILKGGVVSAADANYTHYGQCQDVTIAVPQTLTAARIVILSDMMRPSGTGAATKRLPGDTVCVRRLGYNGSPSAHAVTIRNLTSAGTLLGTLAASSATALYFRFDGTNWAAAT